MNRKTNRKTDRTAAVTLEVPSGVADDIELVLRGFAEEAELDTALVVDFSGFLVAGISTVADVDVDRIGNLVAEAADSASDLAGALGEGEPLESLHIGEDRFFYLREVGSRFILVGVSDAQVPAGVLRNQARAIETPLLSHLAKVKAVPMSLTRKKTELPVGEPEPVPVPPISLRQPIPDPEPEPLEEHAETAYEPEPVTTATEPQPIPAPRASAKPEPSSREEPLPPRREPFVEEPMPPVEPQRAPAKAIPVNAPVAKGPNGHTTGRVPLPAPADPQPAPALRREEAAHRGVIDEAIASEMRRAEPRPGEAPRKEPREAIPESTFDFDEAGSAGADIPAPRAESAPPPQNEPWPEIGSTAGTGYEDIDQSEQEPATESASMIPAPRRRAVVESSPFEMDEEEDESGSFAPARPNTTPNHLSVPKARQRAAEARQQTNGPDEPERKSGPRYSFELG